MLARFRAVCGRSLELEVPHHLVCTVRSFTLPSLLDAYILRVAVKCCQVVITDDARDVSSLCMDLTASADRLHISAFQS